MKRITLLMLSFLVGLSIFSVIPPSTASASTPVLDARVKVTELVKTADNSFYVTYTILKDLEKYETVSIGGSFPGSYRGTLKAPGITIKNTKKGTYYEKIPASPAGHYGWATFAISYFASGGTKAYQESKYLTTKLIAAPETTKFHTVTAAEATLSYLTVNVAPGLAIFLYNMDKRVQFVVSGAYTAFTHLVGYSAVINRDVIYTPTAGNYIKTVQSTSSSGVVTFNIYVYTSKEAYTKGVSHVYSYKRTFNYPK